MFEDKNTKESIERNIDNWVNDNLGSEFKFRIHQKEAIINIIYNIVNKDSRHYHIIEAPTGSGKSLINIISAGVLSEYYNLDSYILCSDLFLFDQYSSFLKSKNINQFGYLKGQTGNYVCARNLQDVRNGECRMAGIPWSNLFSKMQAKDKGFECSCYCEYVKTRMKALQSKVCVMTYQLFLFVFNNEQFNVDSHGNEIFKSKPIIFCDECHNIPSIVQTKFSISITLDSINKICNIYDVLSKTYNLHNSLFSIDDMGYDEELLNNLHDIYKKFQTRNSLYNYLYDIWKTINNKTTTKEEDNEAISKYLDVFTLMDSPTSIIETHIANKKVFKKPFSKEDIETYKLTSWYHNIGCHWSDFNKAIESVGTEFLLKDGLVDDSTVDENNVTITFRCTKEDWMVNKFLLTKANNVVMLSATVGGEDAYVENMGFRYDTENRVIDEEIEEQEQLDNKENEKNYILDFIPSTFDFAQSPIYFLNRFKMSYKEREKSFVTLKQVIYNICDKKFKDTKGMIHTGSYEFAKRLYNDAPPEIQRRMLIYNGSREKTSIVETHKLCNDTIIVGPTLNEGIDLPGDNCRFIIIMKVPYPNLADKLVKEKIKLFPLWYNSTTSNNIIQGIGRGVRFNGDWCVTYILDACFWNLYNATKDQYKEDFKKRLTII